jgi:hypothetical protein
MAACSSDEENTLSPVVTGNFVSAITITNGDITLPDIGATATVQVSATPSDADGVGNYEFRSSNTRVFTVDNEGVVTATGQGSAFLSVVAKNNIEAATKCNVRVVGKLVETITIANTYKNRSVTLTNTAPTFELMQQITITPDDAYNRQLKYTTLDPEVAIVNENGRVTPLWEGLGRIVAEATDGSNISDTCYLTVTITPITSIFFRAITLNLISNVIADNATSGTLHVNTRRNLLSGTECNPDITLPKSGTNSSTNRIIYAPAAASRNTLSYTSSALTVVDVESDANNYLVIKPQNAPGTATVLIEATDGHGAPAATLTVVNHAVYDRKSWTIVDHSPAEAYQDTGGPIEKAISDEDAAAGLVKPDTYNNNPQGFAESYFVVDLGASTKFDYMLTETAWIDGQTASAYRINLVSLYGANTFDGASTSWTTIQENISVNQNSYYIVPIRLSQLSTYRYVKVKAWNSSTTNSYKNYPIWVLKNFWLGSAE